MTAHRSVWVVCDAREDEINVLSTYLCGGVARQNTTNETTTGS